MTDYARTDYARRNRAKKAAALAAAALDLGMQTYELTLVGGTPADRDRRTLVRKAAGLDRTPSTETWTAALAALEDLLRAVPGVRACQACGHPVLPRLTPARAVIHLDPMPHPRGRVHLIVRDGQTVAEHIVGHQTPPDAGLYRQHSVSCPRSTQAATRRRAEAPRCPICREPMDGGLYMSDPTYRTHPACDPRGEVRPRGRGT